jgi:hypothetical protein
MMTSKERLLTVLRRGRPDRVPVTIYGYSRHDDAWYNREPSYAPLIELETRYGDSFVSAPVDCPVFIGDPNVVRGEEEVHPDGSVVMRTEIDTPKGKLKAVSRRDPGLMTNWQIEPLVKSDEDIERLLSMPDPPAEVKVKRLGDLERRIGEDGILCFSVGDALGHVVGLFDFEDFVMRCYADDGPILALLDKAQEQVLRAIRAIGPQVKNAAFRLWGPEYAGAPLMDPLTYFARYVVDRDRQATDAIHSTGNFSVIHCHGRLHDLLDMIVDIGADALEPLETLPMSTADVTLAELKQRVGSRICLMGAVQAHTLETGTAEAVRQQVREAIEVAAGDGGFVLLPTSPPFMVPLEARSLDNFRAMYLSAHEFGSLG